MYIIISSTALYYIDINARGTAKARKSRLRIGARDTYIMEFGRCAPAANSARPRLTLYPVYFKVFYRIDGGCLPSER